MEAILWRGRWVNSLWPSDTIWRHKSGSTLAQVMASFLTAPSHYLNQCGLVISKVQWHSSECNFTRDTSAISQWNKLENYLSKILFQSPWGQWVNSQGMYLVLPEYFSCNIRWVKTDTISTLEIFKTCTLTAFYTSIYDTVVKWMAIRYVCIHKHWRLLISYFSHF